MINSNPCKKLISYISLYTLFFLASMPALSLGSDHQEWSHNLGIYEVNVRQYSEEGTFSAFETHLNRLQEMGIGILWFMPIHPIGAVNRLGSLGSYYSVRDYYEVNPEFGTLDEFRTLVEKIHQRGMYVLIDWIANHTSWDNALTTEHPEWYCKDNDGNFIIPPGTNWSDVIELDYDQQGLRDYMIDAMKFWVEDVGIDGFRCDAVSFVPQDFWEEAIDALKATKPDIFFLAEGDGRVWHDLGFDMTHGWGLYGFGGGVLKRIADGDHNANDLYSYTLREKTTYSENSYRMYFTSNHDENSWHGTTEELFGDAAEAFAVLAATFNGMPLIYSGQEAGLDKRLLFFDKDLIIWCEHTNAALYSKLLHLKRENTALWNGQYGGGARRVFTTNNADVFAFIRENGTDRVFVVLNLSDYEQRVTLIGNSFVGAYRDVFSDSVVIFWEESDITLSAWRYAVYEDTDMNAGVFDTARPVAFILEQNYPNPFNAATRISYSLAAPSYITLTLIDVMGRESRILDSGLKRAGGYECTFTANDLPSGVYLYRLQVGDFRSTKRLVVIR